MLRDCGAAVGRTQEQLVGPSNEAAGSCTDRALHSRNHHAASPVTPVGQGPIKPTLAVPTPKNSLQGVTMRTERLRQGTALAAPLACASQPAGSVRAS